jgi:hypothetical protein
MGLCGTQVLSRRMPFNSCGQRMLRLQRSNKTFRVLGERLLSAIDEAHSTFLILQLQIKGLSPFLWRWRCGP